MKLLESGRLEALSRALSILNGDSAVQGRVESYSCKMAGAEKSFYKRFTAIGETTLEALSPPESVMYRYGVLRRRLCVCFVWWMSAVFVFYGLAASAASLAGSAHANYALLAAAELPALLLNTLLLDRAGRRPLLTAALLTTAAALIAMSCLPQDSGMWSTGLYLMGKMGATMTLNALYVYTAELFPTRARQRLLAACSTLGRVGAILAPLTPLLAVYKWWLPTLLFGSLPLLSAALTRLVPDTLHRRLPDCFADLDDSSQEEEPSAPPTPVSSTA